MTTGYKINDQGALYYGTFQIVNWLDLFTRKAYKDILIDSLKFCQENKGLEIYAYVIMSNHMHLLIRSEKEILSDTIRDFKSYTAKEFLKVIDSAEESRKEWMLNLFEFAAKRHKRNSKYQIWTHENHAELIYSNKFIDQKINYIHENPVRAGIVENAEDYVYSSAGIYAGQKGLLDVAIMNMPVERMKSFRTIR
jgi:REP element-mobilizing transposase RayT